MFRCWHRARPTTTTTTQLVAMVATGYTRVQHPLSDDDALCSDSSEQHGPLLLSLSLCASQTCQTMPGLQGSEGKAGMLFRFVCVSRLPESNGMPGVFFFSSSVHLFTCVLEDVEKRRKILVESE